MDTLTVVSSFVKMAAALCAVLALMIGFHWLVKTLRRRSPFLNGKEDVLRVVASRPLNHKNSLLLVDVLGELFLVGLSGGQMTCMSALSDPSAKEKVRARSLSFRAIPEGPAPPYRGVPRPGQGSSPGTASMKTDRRLLLILAAAGLLLLLTAGEGLAETLSLPGLKLQLDSVTDQPERLSSLIHLVFVITVLSLAPAILLMMTSFIRIAVVLSLLRQALGTQQMPPNQIVIGLALFLTFFIMTPVWKDVHRQALTPYYEEKIGWEEAFRKGEEPIRAFLLRQTREKDLALFVAISGTETPPEKPDQVSLAVLIPAFIISELKTAFQIGFMIYLPFFIIDMVVASVLLSMGMLMLPPIMMSLPFKLLLFVLVDGWNLIVGSLVRSFQG